MTDLGWLAECIILGLSILTIWLIWKCYKMDLEESETKRKLDEIFEDQTRCNGNG